jgi:hypothetical protein
MGHTDKIVASGTSWTTVLVLIFAVLKLMGLSNMSWLWVFSPWWIGIAFGLGLILVIFVLLFFLSK